MNAIDTNVILYAHDPRDPVKRSKAAAIIEHVTDGVLLWQVACEYIAASRKLGSFGYNQLQAWEDIHELRETWTTIIPSWNAFERAEQLLRRFSLSFWDALIIAACLEAGVERLYSEDISGYPAINGLVLVNPF